MKKQSSPRTITASQTIKLLFSTPEAATYLDGLYSRQYLEKLRKRSPNFPRYRKINGKIFYHRDDLDKLIEGQAPESREVRTDGK
ncbi:MAG: hypothetical protein HQK57_02780 [Deltaproteobacteria bacterium]|nr:hypothetical protein [Deltaproteobacteria bacterium]